MRRGRSFTLAALLLGLALLAGAAGAQAEPGPIELVSKSATEQADSAEAPAISADGRYVAFAGRIGGRRGVFRKDLATGAIVAVSAGDAYEKSDPAISAENPSISADGRYVSFTTRAPLDPVDDGAESRDRDVYVADMSTSPPTYELASARDGCDPTLSATPCGLAYAEETGSVAAGRVALSADGREVAFVVTARSDLTNPPGQLETPAGQVVVRNLATDRTTLVSTERDPLTGAMTEKPVEGGAVLPGGIQGAALSGDGTTVAWLAADLAAQVQMPPGKEPQGYNEPLWRRIGAGPAAPTERIIGSSTPWVPALGGLCQLEAGWFETLGVETTPQLSANGDIVALLGAPGGIANLYVADMATGTPPRELTREIPIQRPCQAGSPENIIGSGPVTEAAISPGGNRIAFSTSRQQFPLSPPHLATQAPSSVGLEDLYVLDLGSETIERLTPANRGEASRSGPTENAVHGAGSVSFDESGEKLAFASGASNLVPGDANGASDAFVVADPIASTAPGETSISAPPGRPQPVRRRHLAASAVSMPDGRVKVRALVPGAGRLQVKARAQVGPRLRRRAVAAAAGRAPGEGLLPVVVRLKPAYRGLARARPGLPATLRLSFRGPGGKPLHTSLSVRFVARPKRSGKGGRGR